MVWRRRCLTKKLLYQAEPRVQVTSTSPFKRRSANWRLAGNLVHRGDAQALAEGLRRERVKPSQQLKPRLLALIAVLGQPSISELHHALLRGENLSYGTVANMVRA